ncbi:MAG: hypothetical protein WDZ48_05520 [Pirellulales bacterium]
MEQPRPRLQARAVDDLGEGGPQVGVCPPARPQRRLAESLVDDVDRALVGQIKGFLEVLPEFREQRDRTGIFPRVMLGLRRLDDDSTVVPVDVLPAERQHLARAAQSSVASQGDNRPPMPIGAAIEDLGDLLPRDEPLPVGCSAGWGLHVGKWVLRDQLPPQHGAEKCPRELQSFVNRRRGQLFAKQMQLEGIGIARCDRLHVAIGTKE